MGWRSSLSASNDLSGIFSLSLESEWINQYSCDVSVQRSRAADVSFSLLLLLVPALRKIALASCGACMY